jgi:hypothetical protein
MFPFFPQQLASLRRARARPRTAHWRRIENVLGDSLTALYENAVTPDVAWQRANDVLEPIHDQQRRMEASRAEPATAAVPGARDAQSRSREILDEPSADFSFQMGESAPRSSKVVSSWNA